MLEVLLRGRWGVWVFASEGNRLPSECWWVGAWVVEARVRGLCLKQDGKALFPCSWRVADLLLLLSLHE